MLQANLHNLALGALNQIPTSSCLWIFALTLLAVAVIFVA
jgi:hypothetical protein